MPAVFRPAKQKLDAIINSIDQLQEILIKNLYNEVYINFKETFSGIISSPQHLDNMTRDSLNFERSKEQLQSIEKGTGEEIRNRCMLEIGSGHGLSVALARLAFGANAFGIEPGEDEFTGAYAISKKVLDFAGLPQDIIQPFAGESVPYEDNHFDIVFSSNVLEHVQDPQRVITESLRVLKPGGYLHFVIPNYGSWWEGHYGVLWIPNLPKWLGRAYVRMLGRDPAFLDTLQLINRNQLEKIIQSCGFRVEVIDWGQDIWLNRLVSLNFAEYAALSRLKRLLQFIHKLRLVNLVVFLGKKLHWETPFVLTLRKNGN